uniref:protein-tyrosine-phosphatase n=1 Tax=Peronospora matthiolae TaxID=2874970 RepID=A0AAV1VLB1_9STRA
MSFPVGYMEPPSYIQPSALVEILRNPDAANKRPVIIDVRDTDYVGGHIRSAVNIPEDSFMDDDDVDALVAKYKDEDAVVFHCMMSQVRGPSCAKRFKARMEVVLEGAAHKPRVLILHGGYERFGSMYKNEADLIEMDA